MKMTHLSLTKSLFFALLSGAMVIPISYLESFDMPYISGMSIIDIFIGTTFALLVMAPFQNRFKLTRTILLILSSILIYTGVSYLAISHYDLLPLSLSDSSSITISGGLGALLTGIAVQLFAPIKPSNMTYPALVFSGLITGYIFSHTILSSNIFINSIGFIVWQMIVCYSLYATKK